MNAIFDCNIFDQLQASEGALRTVRERISNGGLRVIMPRSLWQEVSASPHAALARSLPVDLVGDSVMFVKDEATAHEVKRKHHLALREMGLSPNAIIGRPRSTGQM